MFELDAIAYPGNSGSPVWHPDTGEVLGVVNSVYVKGAKEAALSAPSGISYAIPVKYVHQLLEQALPKTPERLHAFGQADAEAERLLLWL